jgi:hypothetical protein
VLNSALLFERGNQARATAIYVPGKKIIVRRAIPFMAELSCLEAAAI